MCPFFCRIIHNQNKNRNFGREIIRIIKGIFVKIWVNLNQKKGNKMKKIIAGLALVATTSVLMADGAALYKPCAGCHGAKAEKAALGKSQIIKGWDVAKTTAALKGYKDGSYGGAMKGVMKGQVATLDDAKIAELAKYIAGLK